MIVADHFFRDIDRVRQEILNSSHKGSKSPFDGVFYPGINMNISEQIREEIYFGIRRFTGIYPGGVVTTFSRLSLKGVKAPHQAHTDIIMGKYTALVYLNTPEQCQGGTSILTHLSGMSEHPQGDEQLALWERDTNDPSKWLQNDFCAMKSNRLLILDSKLFHRAEPTDGFGDSIENGRLVLTCFFS